MCHGARHPVSAWLAAAVASISGEDYAILQVGSLESAQKPMRRMQAPSTERKGLILEYLDTSVEHLFGFGVQQEQLLGILHEA